jgi:hypothetical protein
MTNVASPSETRGTGEGPTSKCSTPSHSWPLIFERLYPFGAGALASTLYLLYLRQHQIPESFNGVFGAVIGLAGIAAGFLATAKSIVIALDDKPMLRKLKKTPYYRLIVRDLRAAITYSCLLAVYSTAALLVDLKEPWTLWRAILFASWLWLTVTTVLAYWRVMRVYNAILDAEDF